MKIRKGDIITIVYLAIHLKTIKKKLFTGICLSKKKETIKIKSKIKKENITKIFLIKSPIILKIIKNKKKSV
jgi:ribosomal protein L19